MRRIPHTLGLVFFLFAAAAQAAAGLNGHWDGALQVPEGKIAFRFDIGGTPEKVEVTYFDGDTPVRASTGGHLKDGALEVEFASYASKLTATLEKDGALRGTIGAFPFEARPAPAKKAEIGRAHV